jgi:hypothetical protein
MINAMPAIRLSAPPPIAAVPKTVNPIKNTKSAQPDVLVVPPIIFSFRHKKKRSHPTWVENAFVQ